MKRKQNNYFDHADIFGPNSHPTVITEREPDAKTVPVTTYEEMNNGIGEKPKRVETPANRTFSEKPKATENNVIRENTTRENTTRENTTRENTTRENTSSENSYVFVNEVDYHIPEVLAETDNKALRNRRKKELKNLSRNDLLELLLAETKENERLATENLELRRKLEDYRINIESCGSMAEAALKLSGVFQACDEACKIFTENAMQKADEKAFAENNGNQFETDNTEDTAEIPTEASTEVATEISTEVSTENSTEDSTEISTEASTEISTETTDGEQISQNETDTADPGNNSTDDKSSENESDEETEENKTDDSVPSAAE